MRQTITIPISREDLIRALRIAGLKVPDSAVMHCSNGQEYDALQAATIGVDGPLQISFEIDVDVGEIRKD